MSLFPELTPQYSQALTGDYGFIMSIAITMLVFVLVVFAVKLYLTCLRHTALNRQAGSVTNAVKASDAMWFLAHVFGLVYFGTRLQALGGLIQDSTPRHITSDSSLARTNLASEIFFVLALYQSSCSVLCTVIAIPNISTIGGSGPLHPTYVLPLALFLVGCLLEGLSRIGCSSHYVFSGFQHLCPASNARVLPAIFLIILVDITLAIRWSWLVYRRNTAPHPGSFPRRRTPWPVAPFILRLFVAIANIAYCVIHIRYTRSKTPFHSIFYAELASITFSLTATSFLSLSRVLGYLNFAGVAYNLEPDTSSYTTSGVGHPGEAGVSASMRSPARGGGRRMSDESEIAMLGDTIIMRTVDIHVTEQYSPSSTSLATGRIEPIP